MILSMRAQKSSAPSVTTAQERLDAADVVRAEYNQKMTGFWDMASCSLVYSTQITSWSPQGVRVLRQCKVSRAEVIFVTIQRERIRPWKKEMNKAWTCPMFAVRLWITTSPYRWPTGSLPSTCMLCSLPHRTKDVYTPQGSTRDLWTIIILTSRSCVLPPSSGWRFRAECSLHHRGSPW
jgi:hypothetical protein